MSRDGENNITIKYVNQITYNKNHSNTKRVYLKLDKKSFRTMFIILYKIIYISINKKIANKMYSFYLF